MRLEIILLGAIQGLSEWLPISSTGHLKLAELFLGLKLPLIFDVLLHMGTLIVTVLFFRADVRKILAALARLDFRSEGGELMLRVAVGSIPTAIIGLIIASLPESFFHEVETLAFAFLASGSFIYLSKLRGDGENHVDYKSAVLVGVAQGFSAIPGLSRSGLTIAAALMLGVKREEAFRFSFMLSIPAVTGALVLMLLTQSGALPSAGVGMLDLFAGVLAAAIIGYASLKILSMLLARFHVFAYYSLSLGFLLTILSLLPS